MFSFSKFTLPFFLFFIFYFLYILFFIFYFLFSDLFCIRGTRNVQRVMLYRVVVLENATFAFIQIFTSSNRSVLLHVCTTCVPARDTKLYFVDFKVLKNILEQPTFWNSQHFGTANFPANIASENSKTYV